MTADNAARWADAARHRLPGPAAAPDDPGEDVAPNRCFATVWGAARAAPMVEFRLPDGTTEAFGYGWLRRVATDARRRLVLDFTPADRVVLEGYNLARLRGLLALHRVTWVAAVDPLHAGDGPDPVVTAIAVETTGPAGE